MWKSCQIEDQEEESREKGGRAWEKNGNQHLLKSPPPPPPPLNQPPPFFPSTLTRRATRRPWRQCLNAYQRTASLPKWPRTLMCFTFSDTSELLALSQKYTQCNSPQDYGWWEQTRPVTSKGCRDLLLNVYYIHSLSGCIQKHTHARTHTHKYPRNVNWAWVFSLLRCLAIWWQ